MLISSTMSYLESIFYAVPLSLLPLLNTTARMDLIDFYKEQQSAAVVNSIGGETTLESLEEKCITLRYTPASNMENGALSRFYNSSYTNLLC